MIARQLQHLDEGDEQSPIAERPLDVFTSQTLVYVRSLEAKEKERCYRLEQDVAKQALIRTIALFPFDLWIFLISRITTIWAIFRFFFSGKRLTEKPVVGQMVLAYFPLDENYYRAIVTKVELPKIMVKYVDYGNEEESNMEGLYILPDELKEVRIITHKNAELDC